MEKYIYDNGLWYEHEGDYYIPCSISEDPATIPISNSAPSQVVDTESHTIGTWGKRHLTYLRIHSPSAYREFLRNGKLNSYLAQIDASALAMFDRLVIQLAKIQGITEELKAQNEMEWVRIMNSIRHTAEEIVLTEVIYQ